MKTPFFPCLAAPRGLPVLLFLLAAAAPSQDTPPAGSTPPAAVDRAGLLAAAREVMAAQTYCALVTIDETGRVIAARVVKSTTIQSLNEAAREAAMGWLFTPAKQRDVPVKARIIIPFEFTLRSS